MLRSLTMVLRVTVVGTALCGGLVAAQAATVMQQCGQQYQAAKAAGTLNGMTWNQYRTDCASKLKAEPASVNTAPAAAPAPVPTVPAANPLNPAPAATPEPATTTAASPAPKAAVTGGRAAFVARERECGSEWRANKVTLIAQTPGLTWPKYLSSCNTRLKAAGK